MSDTSGLLGSLIAAFLVTACFVGPNYMLTKTGPPGPSKPAGCEFVIATTKVERPYQEVAILDAQVWAEDAASFKQTVAAQVCEVGGDGVIAEVNGNGRYVRGTVFRWKGSDSPN